MTIRVINAGLALFQDAGRKDFLHLGVPRSGVASQLGFQLTSRLIKEDNPSVIEILAGQFEFEALGEIAVAVVGNCRVYVNNKPTNTGNTFLVFKNQNLRIEVISAPVYLAIAGLKVPQVLGSSSFDTLSSIGPRLTSGDVFETTSKTETSSAVGSFLNSNVSLSSNTLHYIPVPNQIDVSGQWEVKSVSRTGVRLDRANKTKSAASLPSFPVIPGCIQITPSGEPVILGVDCGTTGGYPVAGVIIEVDLGYLISLENRVELKPITIAEAKALTTKQEQLTKNIVISPQGFGSW